MRNLHGVEVVVVAAAVVLACLKYIFRLIEGTLRFFPCTRNEHIGFIVYVQLPFPYSFSLV